MILLTQLANRAKHPCWSPYESECQEYEDNKCPDNLHVCAAVPSNATVVTTATTNTTLLINLLLSTYPNLTIANASIVVMSFQGDFNTVIGNDGSPSARAFTTALISSISTDCGIELPDDVPTYFLSGGSYIVAYLLMPTSTDADDTNIALAAGSLVVTYNGQTFKALAGSVVSPPAASSFNMLYVIIPVAAGGAFLVLILGVFLHKRRREPLPPALPYARTDLLGINSSSTDVCTSLIE